jgi:hypothetical protein
LINGVDGRLKQIIAQVAEETRSILLPIPQRQEACARFAEASPR